MYDCYESPLSSRYASPEMLKAFFHGNSYPDMAKIMGGFGKGGNGIGTAHYRRTGTAIGRTGGKHRFCLCCSQRKGSSP